MNYAYVVRQPTDDSEFSQCYCLKFLRIPPTTRTRPARETLRCRLDRADPPVLRKRSSGQFVWDYSNKPISTARFHRHYPHIRLKPGEGPILVDLDDVSTKRTSKPPED